MITDVSRRNPLYPLDTDTPAPLWQQVVDHLLDRIDDGEFPDKLPPRNVLADQYGVAYATISRATSRLCEDGHLVSTHGRGTYVAHPPADAPESDMWESRFDAARWTPPADPRTHLYLFWCPRCGRTFPVGQYPGETHYRDVRYGRRRCEERPVELLYQLDGEHVHQTLDRPPPPADPDTGRPLRRPGEAMFRKLLKDAEVQQIIGHNPSFEYLLEQIFHGVDRTWDQITDHISERLHEVEQRLDDRLGTPTTTPGAEASTITNRAQAAADVPTRSLDP